MFKLGNARIDIGIAGGNAQLNSVRKVKSGIISFLGGIDYDIALEICKLRPAALFAGKSKKHIPGVFLFFIFAVAAVFI